MAYYGDEDYDFRFRRRQRQDSPNHGHTDYNINFLNPGYSAGLQRSRSQGHGRAPTFTVINENNAPYPPALTPPRRESPEQRGRRRADHIVDDLAEMQLRDFYRSRSRGRLDAAVNDYAWQERAISAEQALALQNAQTNAQWNAQMYAQATAQQRDAELEQQQRINAKLHAQRDRAQSLAAQRDAELENQHALELAARREAALKNEWELAQKAAQLQNNARKEQYEQSVERIKADYKLQALQDDLKRTREEEARKERERQVLLDYDRRTREEREKAAEEERRIKDKIDREAREAKERKEREMKELILKQKEDKERREREIQEILLQEKEAREKREKAEKEAEERFLLKQKLKKEKEEREEKEAEEKFLRKQREKKEKEEREKKEAEEKFQNEMRKRLRAMNYTEKTIETLVDEEKAKKWREEVKTGRQVDTLDTWSSSHRSPTYPKIHNRYIAVETLQYYGLPWEYDRGNPDYIIILSDIDKQQTEILFQHTTRLRSGNLLIEAPKKKDKEFAWYRKRSRSRADPVRVGILEVKR